MELTVAWGCIPLMVALGAVQKRGMSRADAEDVIRTMARYDDFFVNIMMKEELGLQVRVIMFRTASLEIQQKTFSSFVGYCVLNYVFSANK